MNGALVEPRAWGRRRWWTVIALVFAGQVGLIFWLGEHGPAQPRPPTPAPPLRLLAGPASAEWLALNDPTLFALPHPQNFSGLTWLSGPTQDYRPFSWTSPPSLLELPEQQLGAAFHQLIESNHFISLQIPAQPEPELTATDLPKSQLFPERSTLRLTGELARRRLLTPLQLPSWTNTDILTNSVVQLLVDAAGRPVSFTLLSSSSDANADRHALNQARAARFGPASGGQESAKNPAARLTWGELIFEWHTVPQPPTNAPAGGL